MDFVVIIVWVISHFMAGHQLQSLPSIHNIKLSNTNTDKWLVILAGKAR